MRNISRLIALFVLLGSGFAIFGITTSTLQRKESNAKQSPTTHKTGSPSHKKTKKRKRSYRVKNGDTLGSIATKFHTTLPRLLELNPDIDPRSLQAGEKIIVPR